MSKQPFNIFKSVRKAMDVTQFYAIAAGGCIALLFIVQNLIRLSSLLQTFNINAKAFSISFSPPTASSFRALDSCPGGLPADLLSSQRLLCLLQGVYCNRHSYAGGTLVAHQHVAGLFWIPLELCLYLARSLAADVSAFSCVNGDDVYPFWRAPCRHQRRGQTEPRHKWVRTGFSIDCWSLRPQRILLLLTVALGFAFHGLVASAFFTLVSPNFI